MRTLVVMTMLLAAVLCASDTPLRKLMSSTQDAKANTATKVGSLDRIFLKEHYAVKSAPAPVNKGTPCQSGPCCKDGFLSKAKTICMNTNPCLAKAFCTGFDSQCAQAPKLPDGTDCYAGKCKNGVCMPVTKQSMVDKAKEEIKAKEKAQEKKKPMMMAPAPAVQPKAPSLSTPIVKSSMPASTLILPNTAPKDVSKLLPGETLPPLPGTLPVCKEGGCCDQFGQIKPKGFVCEDSKHPCYAANAVCDGINPKCPRSYKPDGTSCFDGQCQQGDCVDAYGKSLIPKEPVQTQTIIIAQQMPQVQQVPQMSDEAIRFNAEMQSMARKEEIQRIRSNINERRQMFNMLQQAKRIHHRAIRNSQLRKSAIFPYEEHMNAEQRDDAAGVFKVHNYIRAITDKKRSEALANFQNTLAK